MRILKRDLLPVDAIGKLTLLERLDFVASGQNIILAGNPGTGKNHMAIGLDRKRVCRDAESIIPPYTD